MNLILTVKSSGRFYASNILIQLLTAIFLQFLGAYAQVTPNFRFSLIDDLLLLCASQTILMFALSLAALALCWNVPYSLLQQV